MTSLAARIAGFPKAQPFVFNLGVAAAKTSAADMMTQTVVEKKSFPNGIDWKRNASFTVFGFAYLGGFQYWLQVNMFRKMFVGMDKVAEMPLSKKSLQECGPFISQCYRVKQIAFDIAIHMPFMYFPTFYCVKQLVQGPPGGNVVVDGLSKYKENWVVDQTAMVKVWLPADVVFFSGPLWLRLPLRHVVSFGWTARCPSCGAPKLSSMLRCRGGGARFYWNQRGLLLASLKKALSELSRLSMSQTSSVLTFSALRSRSGDLERFFRSAAFFGGHGDGFSAAAAARYSRGTLSAATGGAARGGGGAAGSGSGAAGGGGFGGASARCGRRRRAAAAAARRPAPVVPAPVAVPRAAARCGRRRRAAAARRPAPAPRVAAVRRARRGRLGRGRRGRRRRRRAPAGSRAPPPRATAARHATARSAAARAAAASARASSTAGDGARRCDDGGRGGRGPRRPDAERRFGTLALGGGGGGTDVRDALELVDRRDAQDRSDRREPALE